MQHVMLDIETLGTKPGCIVLSVGAVSFDLTGGIGQTFHQHIDVEDCHKRGLRIDPRTMMWWFDQSEEARKRVFIPGSPLDLVLLNLATTFDWDDTLVWCNGAAFDFPILDAAYAACGMKKPWAYYAEMDFRTIKNLYKPLYDEVRVKPEVAHDGLEDAIAQAKTLIRMMRRINGQELMDVAA